MLSPLAPAALPPDLPRDPLSVTRMVLSLYLLGDTPGVLALTHPDALWHFVADRRFIPYAGRYIGHDIRRFFDWVKDNLDLIDYRILSFEPRGDTVTFFAHERLRVKATGKIYEDEQCGIITVRDGKVSRYLEFADTAPIAAALAP
jgi:hypothetical protein